MNTANKALVVSIVNNVWKDRYVENHYKERWVLPPGANCPLRQAPWPERKDSTFQTSDGRWLLTSSPDGVRYEIVTAQIMVDKVLAEYLDTKDSRTDLQAFCDNLCRKYEGVRAEDALWIIQFATQFEDSLRAQEPASNATHSPTLETDPSVTNKQDPIRPFNPPKAPRSMFPQYPDFSKMSTDLKSLEPAQLSPFPGAVKANVWKKHKQQRLNPYETPLSRKENTKMTPNDFKLQIEAQVPNWPARRISNYLEVDLESLNEPKQSISNQNELRVPDRLVHRMPDHMEADFEWKQAADHHLDWVRRDFVAFRLTQAWQPEEAHKNSIRWHRVWELVKEDGETKNWHEYDERQVNSSNVIRAYCPNPRFPLKTTTVDGGRPGMRYGKRT